VRRKLIVTLPRDAYGALKMQADEAERAVDQQASFLLRELLLKPARSESAPPMAPAGDIR
jgi:hypothetical protein